MPARASPFFSRREKEMERVNASWRREEQANQPIEVMKLVGLCGSLPSAMACFGWWLIWLRGYGPAGQALREEKANPTKKASQKQRE